MGSKKAQNKLKEIEKFVDYFMHDCQSPHDIAWNIYDNADVLRDVLSGKSMSTLTENLGD